MRSFFLVLLSLAIVESRLPKNLASKVERTEMVEQLRIGKEPFEAVRDMHNMWYVHSLKGLLVQMAKELVPKLDDASERGLLLCLRRIPVKTDIVRASECLVAARRSITHRSEQRSFRTEPSSFIVGDSKEDEYRNENTPVKKVATHDRFKRSEYRLVEKEGTKRQRNSLVRRSDRSPDLLTPGLTPVQRFSKALIRSLLDLLNLLQFSAILTVVHGKEEERAAPWSETYKSILTMKKSMDAQWKSPGARVYDLPMDRLVFEKGSSLSRSPPVLPSRSVRMPEVVERAFSLADAFSRSSKDANVKMLSPRFAPVLPDKLDGRGSLSPSILAFYKDDAEDQIVPLPTLLKAAGMQKKDRESLLEMIMEVSGARKTVDAAMETLQKIKLFGVEGPFLAVTKRMEEAFHELEKSFTRKQRKDMRKRKFAFLDKDQLQTLYSKQGVTSEHHEELDLDAYELLTADQREEALWKRIEIFAANQTEEPRRRSKREDFPGEVYIKDRLEVLDATVLHPYMFRAIYGLSVLGPTVLSPSLFSPLILNPSVISPWVLSPAIGMPFILSPYLLSPYVLSPMVFDPFILSPYALSPNVINPYVFSPLVLSPLFLCPDVLSPMVFGGNILSPAFASPAIFSKNLITVSVLSPSFLS